MTETAAAAPRAAKPVSGSRILSIDVFRGGTIVAMVFVNFVAEYSAIPGWSKHTHDQNIPYGLTYVDLIAPFFIFAIALTYHQSYRRSLAQSGRVQTILKFVRRYFALLGMGLIVEMTPTPASIIFGWAVLPTIGLAGMVTLLFIRFPRYVRLALGLALLAVYQFALGRTVVVHGVPVIIGNWNYSDVHGGFIGGLGYGLMMMLGTVVGEAIEEKRLTDFLWFGVVFTAAGVATHFIWRISKDHVTVPFILISLGLASLTFYAVWYLYDHRQLTRGSSRFLQPQGKNALFLYLLHGLLVLIAQTLLPTNALLGFVLVVALGLIAAIWGVAVYLDRKRVYLTL
jgi:predicted acyltransferase